MTLKRDTLMKIGVAAAVVLIIYLIYRSRSCKDTFAAYAQGPRDDEYAEKMFAEGSADYAEEYAKYAQAGDEDYAEEYAQYAKPGDEDYAEEYAQYTQAGDEDYAEEYAQYGNYETFEQPRVETFTNLMQSTLDDDEANAMFEPEM